MTVHTCAAGGGDRNDRKYKIVAFLREKGLKIDLAEVEALVGGEVIARLYFAQALVKHGYVSANQDAFDRYLDTSEFLQKVKRVKADTQTCAETIKAVGGKASLTHNLTHTGKCAEMFREHRAGSLAFLSGVLAVLGWCYIIWLMKFPMVSAA